MISGSLMFLFSALLVVLLGTLCHLVLWNWAKRAYPSIVNHRKLLFACAGVVIVAQPLGRWLSVRTSLGWVSNIQVALLLELMVVAVTALPLLFLQGVFALARLGSSRSKPQGSAPQDSAGETARDFVERETRVSRRVVLERGAGLTVLGATSAAFGWGTFVGRHAFEVVRVAIRVDGLPKALDGYTIAQVSDLHVGSFVGERELTEGLSLVRRLRPDLVVATGDLVDIDSRYAALMAESLQNIGARDGVYGILGNHDYYAGAGEVRDALLRAGVHCLVNEGLIIRGADGGGFALLGVDDLWARRGPGQGPMLAHAQAMVPNSMPHILLSHQPATVKLWPGRVALQLSGHTHGGQVNPLIRPADLVLDYVAGLYQVSGTALYVNRGFGTAGPPVRIGAPPEITLITLVA